MPRTGEYRATPLTLVASMSSRQPPTTSAAPTTAAAKPWAWSWALAPLLISLLIGNCAGSCNAMEPESYSIDPITQVAPAAVREVVIAAFALALLCTHLRRRHRPRD